MNFPVYYEVRGPRPIVKEDDKGREHRIGVTKDSFLRFSTVFLSEAQSFATSVYRDEKILCTLDEVTR